MFLKVRGSMNDYNAINKDIQGGQEINSTIKTYKL